MLDLEVPTAIDQLAHGTFGGMIDVWGIGSETVDVKEMILYPSRWYCSLESH
jgi:hypothetical protein